MFLKSKGRRWGMMNMLLAMTTPLTVKFEVSSRGGRTLLRTETTNQLLNTLMFPLLYYDYW